uniref:RNase NYN domain-containing protein n=1 Tax=Fundulus heteroclitus TaxID=8078 RepID=A0A3Q2PIU3_FUNHE
MSQSPGSDAAVPCISYLECIICNTVLQFALVDIQPSTHPFSTPANPCCVTGVVGGAYLQQSLIRWSTPWTGRQSITGQQTGTHSYLRTIVCDKFTIVFLDCGRKPELDLATKLSTGEPPQSQALAPSDLISDCRTKVEFALKLGYSEELVLLVLRKLGPDALINDILGELVKLGTKTEMEHQKGPTVSQSPSSSLSSLTSNSSLESCRLQSPSPLLEDKDNFRPVVIDGSNVAMSHGNKEVFSCQGIQLAVDWFLERGHRDITVFVPAWRKEQSRPDAPITDQELLRRLEKEKILVFTPSRRVQGRRVVCYDDRFIVKLAYESDGIIVSNDNYRDLANEKTEWKKFIDERLLMYSFVNDKPNKNLNCPGKLPRTKF